MAKKATKLLLALSILAIVLSAVCGVFFIILLGIWRFAEGRYISFAGISISSFETYIVPWIEAFAVAVILMIVSVRYIVKYIRKNGQKTYINKVLARNNSLSDSNIDVAEQPTMDTKASGGDNDGDNDAVEIKADNTNIISSTEGNANLFASLPLQEIGYVDYPTLQEIEYVKNPATTIIQQTPKVVEIEPLLQGFSEFLKENNLNVRASDVRKILALVVSDEKLGNSCSNRNNFDPVDYKINVSDDLKETLSVYLRQNYIQKLSKTCEGCENLVLMGEESWKKLDSIEQWLKELTIGSGAKTPFEIGNKQWRAVEKYTSVYISCGGSDSQALDNAIADILLPDFVAIVKKKDGLDSFLKKVLEDECSASLSALTRFTLEL